MQRVLFLARLSAFAASESEKGEREDVLFVLETNHAPDGRVQAHDLLQARHERVPAADVALA